MVTTVVVAVAVAGACCLLAFNRAYPDRLTVSSCEHVPVGASPEGPVNPLPYGFVTGCRELAREDHLVGDVDVSTHVLLETERGLVALRVTYRDLELGRFFTTTAVEIAADQIPSEITEDERRRLINDVAKRGGVRQDEWILAYGDG